MADIGNRSLEPLGHQQITTLTAATALTIPEGARCAIISAQTQAVRWRDDGTSPTAAIGIPLAAGADFFYVGKLAKLKFIEQVVGGVLNVAYYR